MVGVAVDERNFGAEVLSTDKYVLLEFWAAWCGPCKMMEPVLADLAAERGESLKICRVNVDEQPRLANEFGVEGVPMMILVKDSRIVDKTVGYQPKAGIEAFLDRHLTTESAG